MSSLLRDAWTRLEYYLHSQDTVTLWTVRVVVTLLLVIGWQWYMHDPYAHPPPLKSRGITLQDSLTQKKDAVQEATLSYTELVEPEQHEQENEEEEDAPEQIEEETQEDTDAPEIVKPESMALEAQQAAPVILVPEEKAEKPRKKRPKPSTTTTETPSSNSAASGPSSIKATSDAHPGLQQFYHWYNVETSLYRIYELGRTDGVPVIPPFLPKSERGHVPVHLRVLNQLTDPIEVFWVDYLGKEVSKGKVYPGGEWHQVTWIGHPWTFRRHHAEGEVLLHYVPHRVIPSTRQIPTKAPDDPTVGLHQFSILPHIPGTPHACRVVDPVMPHPPEYTLDTPVLAGRWTLQHMERTDYYACHMAGDPTLLKYLTNIVAHPDKIKYRQIRTAQPRFRTAVWNTAARGLLLACGFVEREAFAELGSDRPLSSARVSDVSFLLMNLEQWKTAQERTQPVEQPQGADGFGRANFGRAGAMG